MHKILVVQSDLNTRQVLANVLKTANYYVITARDGKEGLEIAKRHLPDLIITDISLPEIDGLSMLYLLRQDCMTESIPIIVLSDKTQRSDLRNAMEAGADDFITKPFDMDELLMAVESRLKRLQVMTKNHTFSKNGDSQHFVSIPAPKIAQSPVRVAEKPTYCKGNANCKNGTDTECLYFICNDQVNTCKIYEDGKQLVVSIYNEGKFLGYVALLSQSTYKKMAQVMKNNDINVYL